MKHETPSVRLTIVCDDFDGVEAGFKKSYGFALLIEMRGKIILFDTGTHPEALRANLRAYGVNARELDAVILSHNHYDHTDGLPAILEENPNIPVYVHGDWDRPHSFKGIPVPPKNRLEVDRARECPEWVPGLFFTSSFFAGDYGGIYEHACWIVTRDSRILITGCCHPGLDTFLNEQAEMGIGDDLPLYIIGGFHGFRFDSEQASRVDRTLREIVCCHCTSQFQDFQRQFGSKCRMLPVGKSWEVL